MSVQHHFTTPPLRVTREDLGLTAEEKLRKNEPGAEVWSKPLTDRKGKKAKATFGGSY